MNQQILRMLRRIGLMLFASLLWLSLGAQEMIFMESPFDPSVDQAQLLPADQKGTVSWTASTNTLTMKDVSINTQSKILSGYMPEEMTILVEGSNQLISTGSDDAITMRSSVRIMGSGSLSITSQGAYAYACRSGASLTITGGVSVTAVGNYGGLVGDFVASRLLIDNSYVTASTLNNQGMVSIGYFKELTLERCAISTPEGAKVAELNEVMSITADGKEEYAGKVIIAPQQAYYRVSIAEAEHGRVVAPEGVDLTHLLGGATVTFTAKPEEGYALTKLMAGSEDITNTRTLIVKEDVTITPTFSPINSYRVSLQQPEHGSISVRESEYNLEKVPDGSILHFICTPDEGYELERLMAGDKDITAEKYISVRSDVEITASYKLIPVETYKVTIAVLGKGKLEADYPNLEAVPDGTKVQLTCTPEEGYQLKHLRANDEDIMESQSFIIEGVDVRVEATFQNMGGNAIDHLSGETRYSIEVHSNYISISGASVGTPISLRSLLGETIVSATATGSISEHLDLTSITSGIYLLTIGDVTLKLYL